MSQSAERFSKFSKKDIRSRVKEVALQVRAVPEHEDRDYRIAVLATLIDNPMPKAALRDRVATVLPRLDTTSVDEYFSKGTYVDEVRFDRIIGELLGEGFIDSESIEDDGVDITLLTKKDKEK